MRKTKSFAGRASVKDAEQGIAEVVVSAYGNLDFDGDVVLKGASAKQIKGEYGPNPKGMLDHDWSMRSAVAKTIAWWEEDDGLHIEAQYNLAKQVGREAFDDLGFYGDDMQFSVGYEIKESERAPDADRAKGIRRYIKEWVINEWSHVMLGANDQTHLVSMKDRVTAAAKQRREDTKAIVGSFELLTGRLSDELKELYPSEYLWVRGTFPDKVVFDREYATMSGYAYGCYEVSYTLGEDGAFTFGEPVEVNVDEVVEPKALTSTAAPESEATPPAEDATPDVGIDARTRDEYRLLVASTLT